MGRGGDGTVKPDNNGCRGTNTVFLLSVSFIGNIKELELMTSTVQNGTCFVENFLLLSGLSQRGVIVVS